MWRWATRLRALRYTQQQRAAREREKRGKEGEGGEATGPTKRKPHPRRGHTVLLSPQAVWYAREGGKRRESGPKECERRRRVGGAFVKGLVGVNGNMAGLTGARGNGCKWQGDARWVVAIPYPTLPPNKKTTSLGAPGGLGGCKIEGIRLAVLTVTTGQRTVRSRASKHALSTDTQQ